MTSLIHNRWIYVVHRLIILTLTYVYVADDYSIAVAVEEVISLWVAIDDDGDASLRERQRRIHSLCTGRGKKINDTRN